MPYHNQSIKLPQVTICLYSYRELNYIMCHVIMMLNISYNDDMIYSISMDLLVLFGYCHVNIGFLLVVRAIISQPIRSLA